MTQYLSKIERTAYHEAGHVVMAFLVGHKFIKVSIEEDETTYGRVVNTDDYWLKGLN